MTMNKKSKIRRLSLSNLSDHLDLSDLSDLTVVSKSYIILCKLLYT